MFNTFVVCFHFLQKENNEYQKQRKKMHIVQMKSLLCRLLTCEQTKNPTHKYRNSVSYRIPPSIQVLLVRVNHVPSDNI